VICPSGCFARVRPGAFAAEPSRRDIFKCDFLQPFQSARPVQSLTRKYFASVFRKCVVYSARPASARGAYRDRHEREAGCGGRNGACDERAGADGEAVWFWRPYAGVKFARTPTRRADDGVNKAIGPREEHGVSRKTIAWGMPGDSGASAVNTGVHNQLPICAHQAAGASGTRHSPRPLP